MNAVVITDLQRRFKEGTVLYEETLDSWRKAPAKKATKPRSPSQTAADILGGSGGVMDRSEALEQATESTPNRRRARRVGRDRVS